MAKATITARAGIKITDNVKFNLHDRDDDHLRQAQARVDRKGLVAAVPAGNQHLSLIIGINESNQVPENDPMFMAEPRARKNDCRQFRVFDVNGNAGGYQLRLPWFNEEWLIDASAEIDSS